MNQTQSVVGAAPSNLWREGYEPRAGVYDELYSDASSLRPHWRTFVSLLDQMGPREHARRWEQGKRLIRENGITYNVYGDPRGMDRPWGLDSIPLLISAQEWNTVEQALIQRAQLLNLILQDLYGPQTLLRAGVLPPELVFAHPGFLRPCHGMTLPASRYLHLYSADIARSPDGQWSVIADCTQAPAGAGYALENRIVLSRMFPEVFKECKVQRLAIFFRKMRATLTGLAPYNRDNPRIVLLTAGHYNETYFEHAYLARYLNYTLVEGGDLTVRDECAYLKTLGGLHRVDVILRRMDDDFCDPLELRPDSVLGIPGLLQAARAGNVAIANPLGSGVAETPALKPFLPKLCRHLLNEDLKMPSIQTYWCGDPKSCQHTLANLEQMVVKPAFPSAKIDAVFGSELSLDQREDLVSRIKARPHWYVAQEQLALSTVPVAVGERIQPRHAVLRTYLVSSDGVYTAMPGGLTQLPVSQDTLVFSLQQGGGSKDTWVQSAGPVSNFSLLMPADQHIELSRGGSDLPSRVADNLFWLGRYVERAESSVRLLRGIVIRLTDKSVIGDSRELPELLAALGNQRRTSAGTATPEGPREMAQAQAQDELAFILAECRRPGGLQNTLKALQDVVRAVRDRISTDTWRVIKSLDSSHEWPEQSQAHLGEVLSRLNFMVITLASFGGLASESMTRGQVWRFMDMGRRLERSINLSGLLRSTLTAVSQQEAPLLEAMLEINDSFMTYRRRYLASLQLAPVLDLLLADETNPRSLAFQFLALNDHVDNLPRDKTLAHLSADQRITMGGLSKLRLIDIDALCEANSEGKREHLDNLLEQVKRDMAALSDVITRNYLSHSEPSRQLAYFKPEVM